MPEVRARSLRLQLLLMLAIVGASLGLGFWLLPDSPEEERSLLSRLGTTNRGLFLSPPPSLAALPLRDERDRPWRADGQRPRWRILVVGAGDCEGICGEWLLASRQVHIRLGKNAHRVERVLVLAPPRPGPLARARIAVQHPHVPVVRAESEALARWLAGGGIRWTPRDGLALVVDPRGRAVLAYDRRHSGEDLLEDLEHLLKYSP
ncbi:MAG: hypothetical protein KatS3mg124_2148 [Porticoccaceae bacterium]|nr:MAG: hypothetical protein KatS3mg124_2148 [Porticoccaceae bacterium]